MVKIRGLSYLLPLEPHLRDPLHNATHLKSTENNREEDPEDFPIMVDPPRFHNISSNFESVFDDLITTHERFGYDYSENPSSATVFVRNIILATWEVNVARASNASFLMADASRENDGSIEALQLNNNRITESHQKLIEQRRFVRYTGKQVAMIMREFQCERDSSYHSNIAGCQKGNISNSEEIEQERIAWKFLAKELEDTETQINQHAVECVQRVKLNEPYAKRLQILEANKQTEAANGQARSIGQLTKIATAVVPLSVVASIFSMGGNFAAGEKYFKVYWAISLPVTLALLTWVLHNEIKEVSSQLADFMRSKKRKSDDSEHGTSDRESGSIKSNRNWRNFWRRQRRYTAIYEEGAIGSHSKKEREFRMENSGAIVRAHDRFFKTTRLDLVRLSGGTLISERRNSRTLGEESSIVSESP